MQQAIFTAHCPYELGDIVEVAIIEGMAITGYPRRLGTAEMQITDIITEHSLKNGTVCLMGADALEAFLMDEEVLKVLDTRRFEAAVITPKELPNGATYIGTIHEIAMDIYTYNEWYLDNWTNKEEPEDKPLLPANIVVLLSTEANYSMYYGAVGVTDEAGKTIEVVEGSRIPEQWVERRPPRRFLQLNSAPLCVPHEVDSWYVATVC